VWDVSASDHAQGERDGDGYGQDQRADHPPFPDFLPKKAGHQVASERVSGRFQSTQYSGRKLALQGIKNPIISGWVLIAHQANQLFLKTGSRWQLNDLRRCEEQTGESDRIVLAR
jgi:hypothetical protein